MKTTSSLQDLCLRTVTQNIERAANCSQLSLRHGTFIFKANAGRSRTSQPPSAAAPLFRLLDSLQLCTEEIFFTKAFLFDEKIFSIVFRHYASHSRYVAKHLLIDFKEAASDSSIRTGNALWKRNIKLVFKTFSLLQSVSFECVDFVAFPLSHLDTEFFGNFPSIVCFTKCQNVKSVFCDASSAHIKPKPIFSAPKGVSFPKVIFAKMPFSAVKDVDFADAKFSALSFYYVKEKEDEKIDACGLHSPLKFISKNEIFTFS